MASPRMADPASPRRHDVALMANALTQGSEDPASRGRHDVANALAQVPEGPYTRVLLSCPRHGRRRPGVPQILRTYNKAPRQVHYIDLQMLVKELIEEYGLPLKPYVLQIDDDGVLLELDQGCTPTALEVLCLGAHNTNIPVELIFEESEEELADEVNSLRVQVHEADLRAELAEQTSAAYKLQLDDARRTEEGLRAELAEQAERLREAKARKWLPTMNAFEAVVWGLLLLMAIFFLSTYQHPYAILAVVLLAAVLWKLYSTYKAEKLFVVVDGNLSSTKGPFLRHLMQMLGPDGVQVILRSDSPWADKLVGLYKCTKDNGNNGNPEREQWKAMAWFLQLLMMTNDLLEMYKPRMAHTIVEQSIWSGEFVFRPVHYALKILTGVQLEECTERFNKAVQHRGLPHLFIRLRVDPWKALERIRRKNHPSERDVTRDYLEKLETRFDTVYRAAIEERGGIVIELTVDKDDGTEAEPTELLLELQNKLRNLRGDQAYELKKLFRV